MTYVTSVSLPDHVEDDIKADERSLSELATQWVENYYIRGTPPVKGEMADRVTDLLEQAAEDQRSSAARMDDAINILKDEIEKSERPVPDHADPEPETTVADAKEWWRDQPWTLTLDPDNRAIQTWADDIDMAADELCDELSRVERRDKPDSLTTS